MAIPRVEAKPEITQYYEEVLHGGNTGSGSTYRSFLLQSLTSLRITLSSAVAVGYSCRLSKQDELLND